MKKNLLFLLLVIILAIPSFQSLLRSGFFPIQDDMQVFRLQQMGKCFSDGQIPCRWIPDAGYQYGYPLFNYYSPLVYYVGQIFHLVSFQYIDSIKILFILGFLLATVFMYLLAKEFFGKWPGLVSSVLYIYAPYKAQEVYVRGALSEFWASVFFPLVLWALYKLITNKSKKYFLWSALAIAGLFLTHNLLSFLFIPIVLFWIIYWLIVEKKFIAWKKLILAITCGLGISMFFLLPMLMERNFVHLETLVGGYFDYRQHFVSLSQLFLSNHWGYGSSMLGPNDDLSLSTGIVQWIIGVVAVILAALSFKKNKKLSGLIFGFGIIDIVVLFLTHEKSSFVWSIIAPLKWLQFPWRFLSLSVFLLSFLSGAAIFLSKKFGYFLGIAAIIAAGILNVSFFTPSSWLNITDAQKLSGPLWEKELTSSIFDYLPIYAKFPPETKAPTLPEVLKGQVKFNNYYKGSDFQKSSLVVASDATIRLPLFDFPGMNVYLDGNKVSHVNNNCTDEKFCMGLITFDISKGEHSMKVMLENTPVRTIGNVISLLSIAGIIFLLIRKNKIPAPKN